MRNKLYFDLDFYRINKDNAWLLGFIFADSTIGIQQGKEVVRLFHKDLKLLELVKEYYQIPYKIGKQNHKNSTVYFIRFSDPKFVDSLVLLDFEKDRTELAIPKMSKVATESFIKGFLAGKGSFFEENNTDNYGVKVIYRSEVFIMDMAYLLSQYCKVRIARPHCRKIKNVTSCEIKYVGEECDRIKRFIDSGFVLKANSYSLFS